METGDYKFLTIILD